MDRIDVLTALVAVLALAVVAWSKPLQKLSFWVFVLLCVVFHPAGTALFSALESTAGAGGTMAEWTFMFSVNVLFAALVASAHRGVKSLRDAPALGHSSHREISA
jgi:cytochrome b subunit of formate dehydrogenase